MRSYDWRMPEEKYRTIIDHLSDVIYTYFAEYKEQGVARGAQPAQHRRDPEPDRRRARSTTTSTARTSTTRYASDEFFAERGIERDEFYLMTCHRRESVEDPRPLQAILELIGAAPWPIYFPASYRTQKRLEGVRHARCRRTRPWSTRSATRSCSRCWPTRAARSPTRARWSRRRPCSACRRCRSARRPSARRSTTAARASSSTRRGRRTIDADAVFAKLERLRGKTLGARPRRRPRLRAAGRRPGRARSSSGDDPRPPRRGLPHRRVALLPRGRPAGRVPIGVARRLAPWPSLAVVVPVYNEAATIERACAAIVAAVATATQGDARRDRRRRRQRGRQRSRSSSGSRSELELLEVDPRTRTAATARRCAPARAARAELGLEYVAFIDADLTNPPEDLLKIGAWRPRARYIKASRFVAGRTHGRRAASRRRAVSRAGNLVGGGAVRRRGPRRRPTGSAPCGPT